MQRFFQRTHNHHFPWRQRPFFINPNDFAKHFCIMLLSHLFCIQPAFYRLELLTGTMAANSFIVTCPPLV